MSNSTAIALPVSGLELSGRVRALISLRADGVRLDAGSLQDQDREEIGKHLAVMAAKDGETSFRLVAAWCKRLAKYVSNPPAEGDAAAKAAQAIFEVCSDLPSEVWTQRACLEWARQPERNGFPVGSRWPAPGELYGFLSKLAEPLRKEREGLRALAGLIEPPKAKTLAIGSDERKPGALPTEAEREAVRKMVAERRAEVARREAHEAKIRKHGSYTPPGAVGLTGWALLDALKADLPNLDGDLLAVTQERVEEMQRRFEAAERFMTREAQA